MNTKLSDFNIFIILKILYCSHSLYVNSSSISECPDIDIVNCELNKIIDQRSGNS